MSFQKDYVSLHQIRIKTDPMRKLNSVVATDIEKRILKKLTKERVRVWIKRGVSEERMREYMLDRRFRYVLSQKVFQEVRDIYSIRL